VQEKVFPFMLAKSAEIFSFADCSFKVQKSKEATGRVVVHKEFGIANSYTVEASFAGTDNGEHKFQHFTTLQLEALGHHFCETILDYYDPDQVKFSLSFSELVGEASKSSDSEESVGSDAEDKPDLRILNDGDGVRVFAPIASVSVPVSKLKSKDRRSKTGSPKKSKSKSRASTASRIRTSSSNGSIFSSSGDAVPQIPSRPSSASRSSFEGKKPTRQVYMPRRRSSAKSNREKRTAKNKNKKKKAKEKKKRRGELLPAI